MKRIYLDYAATTPVAPEVKKAMEPYLHHRFGNPNSLHSFGQEALAALDLARETAARSIGADFGEIVFTGSATEANNLALRGVLRFYNQLQLNYAEQITGNFEIGKLSSNLPTWRSSIATEKPKIIISAIEHESVLETAKDLECDGLTEVVIIPVDKNGVIDLKKLKNALDERTILVSVMHANNEIGTMQPIAEIADIIRNFKSTKHEVPISLNEIEDPRFAIWQIGTRSTKQTTKNSKSQILNVSDFGFRISDLSSGYPLLHTDAVQAFQYLDCDVNKLGVDFLTLSAHKIYGPKGVGALYIRNPKHEIRNPKQVRDTKSQIKNVSNFDIRISDLSRLVSPIVVGGGQEFGMRSGTHNVPGIVGFAKAIETVSNSRELENKRIVGLRDCFRRELKKIYPKAEVNGYAVQNNEYIQMSRKNTNENNKFVDSHKFAVLHRLSNILNIHFPGYSAGDLLIKLDMAGVAVSSGAACSARRAKPSHVLQALGYKEKRINGSIRFSFGRYTTRDEIDKTLKILKKILIRR